MCIIWVFFLKIFLRPKINTKELRGSRLAYQLRELPATHFVAALAAFVREFLI